LLVFAKFYKKNFLLDNIDPSYVEMLEYWLAYGHEAESLYNFVLQHRIGNLKQKI